MAATACCQKPLFLLYCTCCISNSGIRTFRMSARANRRRTHSWSVSGPWQHGRLVRATAASIGTFHQAITACVIQILELMAVDKISAFCTAYPRRSKLCRRSSCHIINTKVPWTMTRGFKRRSCARAAIRLGTRTDRGRCRIFISYRKDHAHCAIWRAGQSSENLKYSSGLICLTVQPFLGRCDNHHTGRCSVLALVVSATSLARAICDRSIVQPVRKLARAQYSL